jgi:hypothetical protein
MMKSLAVCLAALLPLAATAQTYQGMSEADMKKMMQQAQQMQACMAQVDRAKANALKERSERISKELEALCAQGSRDAAQRKAIAYGKEMADDPTVRIMRRCGEVMKGAMPQMPYMGQATKAGKAHVCD